MEEVRLKRVNYFTGNITGKSDTPLTILIMDSGCMVTINMYLPDNMM